MNKYQFNLIKTLISNKTLKIPVKTFSTLCKQSIWSGIGPSTPDPILGLSVAFNADTNPNKVNLGVGAYRDGEGNPYVLECVKSAQARQQTKSLEYAPIDGYGDFIKASQKIAFGEDPELIERTGTVQTLSGTGALRIGAELIAQCNKDNQIFSKSIYYPNPTWPTHGKIMDRAGLFHSHYYYWDSSTNSIGFDRMIEDIDNMWQGGIILFHACAHNPTGTDPTIEQWKEISRVCAKKSHIVWFDSAYQGFASGNLLTDSESYKIFIRDGHQIILSQSFAKNMGLYGMRTGALHIVTKSPQEKSNVVDKLKTIIRPMYSSPPVEGARIVTAIANDPLLYKLWTGELRIMSERIANMRAQLVSALVSAGSIRDWSHINRQIGMFAYTGINSNQVNQLISQYHIYLTQDGRISIPGLTANNVEYVANAIHQVTK
jgi:aspartate aminotransferase, mitochondrial